VDAELSGDVHWNLGRREQAVCFYSKPLARRIFGAVRQRWPPGRSRIAAYRSQSDAEFGFRQHKDPHVVSFSPMHH